MVAKKVDGKVAFATSGGCISGQLCQKLTPVESDVLFLLSKEFLTFKQVSIRRKCSTQAVYKIVKNLKKKGLINAGLQEVAKSLPTLQLIVPNLQPLVPNFKGVRLHGQEFNIRILYKDERYSKRLSRCNLVNVDGNTIRLFRDSVEVYSGQSFFGEDVQSVTGKSFDYWNRLFVRLENDLSVILVKPRSQNVRLVNQHYAEVGNELAVDCEKKGVKVRVFARDDGKLWFLIDNSFSLHEAESVHPVSAKVDMERVKAHFNDLRDNEHLPLSEVSVLMADTIKQLNDVSHGLKGLVSFVESQLPKKDDGGEGRKVRPYYAL